MASQPHHADGAPTPRTLVSCLELTESRVLRSAKCRQCQAHPRPSRGRPRPWRSGATPARRCICGRRSSGKIRLAQSPWVNHGWSVTLYVTPRGLTTSPIPYGNPGLSDRLRLHRSPAADPDERRRHSARRCLQAAVRRVVLRAALERSSATLDLHVRINATPNESADPIPLREGRTAFVVRPGLRQPVLARAAAVGPDLQADFGRASSASAAPSISSGAPPISRSRDSPAGRRRSIRAACLIFPIPVAREAYCPGSQRVAGSGPEEARLRIPRYYSYAYPAPPVSRSLSVKPAAALLQSRISASSSSL